MAAFVLVANQPAPKPENWEHLVKKYSVLERGESASETGRDHIPPKVFKHMPRLTKKMEKSQQQRPVIPNVLRTLLKQTTLHDILIV